MKIRNRLLFLLVPTVVTFILLICLLFYIHLSEEMFDHFISTLPSRGTESYLVKITEITTISQHIQSIIVAALLMLFLIGIIIIYIAENISRPMKRLNQAALAIAAGDYKANAPPEGPKEIAELANTLNTMSECLQEHLTRLKNSSLVRERMHGEYECTLLLQHYMLQKNIEDFNHPHVKLSLTSFPENVVKEGVLLTQKADTNHPLILTLLESWETGFPGLFHLNQNGLLPVKDIHNASYLEVAFSNDYRTMSYCTSTPLPPLVWSSQNNQFISTDEQEVALNPHDMVFLASGGLLTLFETTEKVEAWLGRILRHFANDGLEIIQVMIANELKFLNKKQHFKQSIQIVGLQMNLESV